MSCADWCPGNLIASLLSAVSQSLACLCMSHLVTHFGGQYLVLQVIESHWVFRLLLDEDSKAIYIHFEVSIFSEVPPCPISAGSKLQWFPCYNRKSLEGLTSLKHITQLNMSRFLQRCFSLRCNWIGGLCMGKLEGYVGIMPVSHLHPMWFLPCTAELAKLLQLQDLGSISCPGVWGDKEHFCQISFFFFFHFPVSWNCQTPIDSHRRLRW